jgi:hypothetical protein
MRDGAAAEDGSSAGPGERGFGAHLDRLLRAAEQEAVQIREVAERRAAALLTEAHAEIARHEQDRRQEWQEREAAVAAAERCAADELAAAREQAAQLVAAAEQEAQGIVGRARVRAEEITSAASEAVERGRRDAAHELERLSQLRDAARAEIQRLLRSLDGVRGALAYELDTAVPAVQAPERSPREVTDGHAGSKRTSAAAAAIGRRRGDLHRARYSGLAAGTAHAGQDDQVGDRSGATDAQRGDG